MVGIGAAAMSEKLVQMRNVCAKRIGQDYCHYKEDHGIAWE